MRARIISGGALLWMALVWCATLQAQQSPGAPGQYSGPNILSRWSRQAGAGQPAANRLSAYLHASGAYLGGLTGPVSLEDSRGSSSGDNSFTTLFGGGLNLTHTGKRNLITLNYLGNYSRSYSVSNGYNGVNQNVNLNFEHQLSRRWGFYTGHTAGTQSNILAVSRGFTQSNLFDQTYSAAVEALDARLKFFNSGAGFYFQKSSRIAMSFDGGVFSVSRNAVALASSRGERAQGEFSYRLDRRQSIGSYYSYSHFYYPRGFGESFVHSVMLSYTRRLNRSWNLQASGGPYIAQSERTQQIAVDPYIASLTGQTTTLTAFRGTSRGVGVNASLNGLFRRQSVFTSYRRAIDPGNGITLTSLSDFVNFHYSYQTTRNFSTGVGVYYTQLTPVLEGAERSSQFRSQGGSLNMSYRLHSMVYLTGNVGAQNVKYGGLGFSRLRKVAVIGLAFSPGDLPLFR